MLMTGAVQWALQFRLVGIVVKMNAIKARDVLEKCLVFFSRVPYYARGFSVDLTASCLAWSLTISSWLSHPYVITECI
jgi:energy-converting hydrogenase Eha subunit F